ncbi:hypothetical protein ACQJBY_054373 [Aegilops geniculata]
MADDHYSSKRKYDDSPPPRRTGFSSGPPPASPPVAGAPVPSSYNTVPPPPDEIQLAKQRAQEIAARLFSAAEAKRPRVDNGDDDAGTGGGGSLGSGGRIGGGGLGFSSSAGGGHASSIPPLSSQGNSHQYSSYGGGYQSGSTTKKIDIPNGRVGVIIGKAGETIKHLQAQSGAKIQVTRDMDVQPGSQTRSVDLSGTPDQINRAEQLIIDVLAEADAGSSGTISNRKYNAPQPGAEQFQMQIANNKVGLVIGKGGETIKSMQAKSQARIQVIPLHLPPGDTSTERTLYIDGTAEQIGIAKQLVSEVTSEVSFLSLFMPLPNWCSYLLLPPSHNIRAFFTLV